jgi:hypothetical protein
MNLTIIKWWTRTDLNNLVVHTSRKELAVFFSVISGIDGANLHIVIKLVEQQ